jgi:hypothetical protein
VLAGRAHLTVPEPYHVTLGRFWKHDYERKFKVLDEKPTQAPLWPILLSRYINLQSRTNNRAREVSASSLLQSVHFIARLTPAADMEFFCHRLNALAGFSDFVPMWHVLFPTYTTESKVATITTITTNSGLLIIEYVLLSSVSSSLSTLLFRDLLLSSTDPVESIFITIL